MGLTTLPTLTDDSLGRVKVDRAPVPNKDEYVSAAELNEIKARVAELATCVGLRNGTTPDSIEARLLNLGGGLEIGAELFRWNGSDTTQFESTADVFEANGGGGPTAGTLALSVVGEATHGIIGVGNVLQIDATSMATGGGVFGILTSELTLPSRYVVRINLLDASTGGSLNVATMLGYTPDDGGGDFQGFYNQKTFGSANHNMRVVVNNEENASSGIMHNGGSWDAAVRDLGGVFHTWTVFNTQGQTPSLQRVLCREELPDQTDEVGFDGQLPHAIGTVGTNWDGINLDRFGIGLQYGGGGTITGFAQIADLRIYAHPLD